MKKKAPKTPKKPTTAAKPVPKPASSAPPLTPMERARQRVETSRKAAINKVVSDSPD